MTEEEFDELAAGHALHALSDADERRFAEALAENPQWRERVDEHAAAAAALAEVAPAVTPPAEIRAALLAQIAQTPQGEPQADPTMDALPEHPATDPVVSAAAAAPRRGWPRRLFTLAASLVLIAGLGVGAAVIVPQLLRSDEVVALDEVRGADDVQQATVEMDSGAEATAYWSEDLGKAVLVTAGMDDAGEGQTYQLWFVRGDTPVAAGVFDPDQGAATAPLEGALHEGDVIAVTVEQDGGSPTGAPTSDPILVIPTA